MTELNNTACDVIKQTDGIRSLEQVASILAEEYEIPLAEAVNDVTSLYQHFLVQKIVEPVNPAQAEKIKIDQNPSLYLCNPEVVFREEDNEGGLLYNPGTGQVKFLNASGLFIWKQFQKPQAASTVFTAVKNAFEDVPAEAVFADVQAFLDDMMNSGFIKLLNSA